MRLHLFEFEDQTWFPHVIRQGMMDYLRHMISWIEYYKPAAPLIKEILNKSGETQFVELCAGGGGGVLKMREYLRDLDCDAKIFLSDLYPNIETYNALKKQTQDDVDFISESVNALNVPARVKGMRLMFSALHHFKPEQVQLIFKDASDKKTPIAIFDTGSRTLINILLILLIQPFTFLLLTPFFKPFRWSRLFFTYIIPLIIICTLWDGCVSVLRFYKEEELKQLASEIGSENYQWQVSHFRNKLGIKVNYVIGLPEGIRSSLGVSS